MGPTRKAAAALALACAALALAREARAGGRAGAFTFDLSGGPGFVWADRRGTTMGGLANNALGVAAGWFVTPRLSITLRATHLFVSDGRHAAFHGLTAQWYAGRVFFGFGPGFVTFGGASAFAAQAPDPTDRGGLGFLARAGVVAFDGPRHAVNVVWETTPGFLKDTTLLVSSLAIEWQFR